MRIKLSFTFFLWLHWKEKSPMRVNIGIKEILLPNALIIFEVNGLTKALFFLIFLRRLKFLKALEKKS